MYFLIPGIDIFNIDSNFIIKMFPLNFSSSRYDIDRSCCFKINSGYCNLKVLAFDRKLVFTLDKWLFEIGECVFFKKKSTLFPTCHFENQSLTDCISILLYLTDLYLDGKKFNIVFKQKLFLKYKHLFNINQQYMLIQILVNLWIENELEQISVFKNDLENRIFSKNMYTCSLTQFFKELNIKDNVCIGYLNELYRKFKTDYLTSECEIVSDIDNVIFLPIQNVCSNWMHACGISKYSTKVFVSSHEKFKRCMRNKSKPPIVFGISFQNCCQLFYCIYNNCELLTNCKSGQFNEWFNNVMNFKSIHLNLYDVKGSGRDTIKVFGNENDACYDTIPIYPNVCIQDFFLLMEIYILRRKFKHFLKKNSQSIINDVVNLDLKMYSINQWPFNNHVLSFYVFFYIYVYVVACKPKRKKKLELQKFTFKNAWNLMLKNKEFGCFQLDFSFQ